MTITPCLLVTLTLWATGFADDKTKDVLAADELAALQGTIGQLIRETEYLQEDIIADLGEQKDRVLYRQADGVLLRLDKFRQTLKADMPRETLYKQFDELDGLVQKLVTGVHDLGANQRALQRTVGRIRATEESLFLAVYSGDKSVDRAKQIAKRQASAFVGAAKDFERVTRYALGDRQGRAVLEGDIKKLVAAAELFEKSAALAENREQLEQAFEGVTKAWEHVIAGLEKLPPAENIYLLRSATRIDQIHDRLHLVLGVKGKRPGLIVRT